MADAAHDEVLDFLRERGVMSCAEQPRLEPLPGGVSSDIWLAETAGARVCVKRALPKLKVAADWRAPVERNAYEVAWMEVARAVVPDSVPRVLAHDEGRGMFAMAYLEPEQYPLWKHELRDGRVDTQFAAAVGDALGRIHRATARSDAIAQRFPTDAIFYDIRLEPYLVATARSHPEHAESLSALVDVTGSTHEALVHGDVSPKNILVGPGCTPVFLDAECAWYGDPAFDLAFCLNHLLLKCLWTPSARERLLACFAALTDAYLAHVDWERAGDVEIRTARLLPGLFLGRVDGKSPVEYVTDETDKDAVRRTAALLLTHPVSELSDVAAAWREELERLRGASA